MTVPEFPPPIALKDGPYDGHSAAERRGVDPETPIEGVSFFPDRLVVTGKLGSAVYLLDGSEDDPAATFDHMG